MGLFGGLEITTRVENEKTVLTLHGRLTIGAGDLTLRDAIQALLDQGVSDIVIDLKNVWRIDSSGMGELVAAHKAISKRGGILELRGLNLPSYPDFPDFPDLPNGFAF